MTCALLLGENAFDDDSDTGGEDAEVGGRLDPVTKYFTDNGVKVRGGCFIELTINLRRLERARNAVQRCLLFTSEP